MDGNERSLEKLILQNLNQVIYIQSGAQTPALSS